MANQPALVAVTDQRWFDFLSAQAVDGRLDEVNFWRPMSASFRALQPGEPVFFRLKHPLNVIAGYGFFAHFTVLPVRLAWTTFEQRNGAPSFDSFLNRIASYRKESPAETVMGSKPVGCIVLREVHFLPPEDWVSWREDEGWHPNIVAFKTYDFAASPGDKLRGVMDAARPSELTPSFELVLSDQRSFSEELVAVREGQGAFRLRVLDAYGRRCAVTGERSLPALQASHIQPYRGPASNHIQNGLSLRADIHGLFDSGYVTVTPELRFEVSRRLREDFENGRHYYELAGTQLLVPRHSEELPSTSALEWHANNVFKG